MKCQYLHTPPFWSFPANLQMADDVFFAFSVLAAALWRLCTVFSKMTDRDGLINVSYRLGFNTPLLTFSLLLGQIPLCRPKIIPVRSYFHVNFIPCLIALLITQSAHREYSSVNDINDIYSSIMSCCWFEAQFCHKLGECFIYVRKHWDLC